ncbi:PLC-like phosphodiesterase, TIM beta/alpha-barrel-containing domain containing protein [Naviculisporaceae sp. PSN 640]
MARVGLLSVLIWAWLAWGSLAGLIPRRQSLSPSHENAKRADDTCLPSDRMYSTETMPAGGFMPWEFMIPGSSLASTKYYMTIVNLTPYRLVKTSHHSYQFDTFDFGDVPSGKARQNTMVYTTRAGANRKDCNGEAYYRLDGTSKTFTIRGTTRIPDEYPMRTVVDLTGMGLGQREYGDPAPETSVTLVIAGSEQYGYTTSINFGSNNWMRQIYDVIKDRKLRHFVMPGSHDAGMGTISKAWVRLGSSANTQTQGLSTYDQLRVGSRYFDMRLVSVNGENDNFWAAHINDERANVPVGATGESLNDIISGINQFTGESPGEIIILSIRYMVNLDSSLDIRTRYWDTNRANAFYTKLEGIQNRCVGLEKTNTKFDRLKAQTLLDQNSGKGCVLILTDGALQAGVPVDRPSSGIYQGSKYMNRDDFWANKQETKSLAEAQTARMVDAAYRRDGDDGDRFSIMQWQCTPDVAAATLYGLSRIAMLPTNPALYWAGVNAMSPEAWPTVIMQDYVGQLLPGQAAFPGQLGAELRALVVGLNVYMVSQNCVVSKRRNPLLGGKMGKLSAASVQGQQRFTGIVYANGTVDMQPPRGFHLGRVEFFKNGTVFGNGTTIIDGDRRNTIFSL